MSKELSPKIEGVVVIADGGENAVVKKISAVRSGII